MRLESPVESNGFVTGALHVLLDGELGAKSWAKMHIASFAVWLQRYIRASMALGFTK